MLLLGALASPVGLEPTTCGLEVRCSVRLSYRDALGRGIPNMITP